MIYLFILIRNIALNLYRMSFSELLTFSRKIAAGLTTHSGTYSTPPITPASMNSDNDALEDAIENWGPPGNRGGHAEYTALIEKRNKVRENLKINANYVFNTTPNNSTLWEAVGFVTKKSRTPMLRMDPVQDLEQVFSKNVPKGDVEFKWRRPQNARRGEKLTYLIFRASNSTDDPEFIGSASRTKYTDTTGNANLYYYYVLPENTFGEGVMSSPLPAAAKPPLS